MVNTRKLGAYGGVGSIFGIVGIILIAKGSGITRMVGLLVIALGVFGVSMFEAFLKHKLKGADDWLEGRTEGGAWLAWFRGASSVLHDRSDEKYAAEEKEESTKMKVAYANVSKTFKKIIDAGRPKEKVMGEKLTAIKEGKPDADSSVDVMDAVNANAMAIHARTIERLKLKHKTAAAIINKMKEETPKLAKKAKKLEKYIEEYGDAWEEGIDHQKRLKKIKKIEELIENSKAEDISKAVKEFASAEKHAEKLKNLGLNIHETLEDLKEDISDKYKDENYETLQKILDDMETSVHIADKKKIGDEDGVLTKAVKEHSDAAEFYFQALHELNDDVHTLTRLSIHEKQAELKLDKEIADAKRAAAESAAKNLDERLKDTTAKKEQWQARAEERAKKLSNLKDIMDKWSSDLNAARAEAKKNPKLEGRVTEVLSNDLAEMSGVMTLFVSTLNARDAHVEKVEQELAETQEKKAELETQKEALEEEQVSSKEIIETAKEEQSELERRIAELKERIETETKEARKAGENTIRERQKSLIDEMRVKLEKAKEEKTAVEKEIENLGKEMVSTQEKAESIQKNLEEVKAKIPVLEKEAKDAKAERDSIHAEVEKIAEAHENKVHELNDKNERLRNRIKGLEHNVGQKEKRILEIRAQINTEKKNVKDAEAAAERAGEDKKEWKERHAAIEEAKNRLKTAFDEEKAERERLAKELEEKENALAEKVRILEGLDEIKKQEAVIEAETAARKKADASELDDRIADQKLEVELLQKRINTLTALESEEESKDDQLKKLKEELEKSNKRLQAEEVRKKDNVNDIRTALEKEGKAKSEAERLAKELETAKAQHATALEELRKETEEERARANQNAESLDEIRGRFESLKRQEEELKLHLTRLNQQFDSNEELVHKALEANDPAAAERASDKRTQMMLEEAKIMGDLSSADDELLGIAWRLKSNAERLVFTFNNFKRSAEGELTALANVVESKNDTINTITGKLEFLEKSKIPGLEKQMREAEKTQQVTPEGLQNMRMEIAALREESTIDTAIKKALQGEVDKNKKRIAELENELKGLKRTQKESPVIVDVDLIESDQEVTLLSRIADEPEVELTDGDLQLTDKADHEAERLDRERWFRKTIINPVEEKKNKAGSFLNIHPRTEHSVSSAINELEEAIHMLNQDKKNYAGQFNEVEEQELANLMTTLETLHGNAQLRMEDVVNQAKQQTPPPVPADALTPKKGGPYREEPKAEPSVIAEAPKVIAIGDVHGDIEKLKKLMDRAGITDHNGKWNSNYLYNTQVVMLGDYIDRGGQTFEVLNFLMELKSQAGNKLTLLCGNHEALFLSAFDWPGFDKKILGRKSAELKKFEKIKKRIDDALIAECEKEGLKLNPAEKLNPTDTLTRTRDKVAVIFLNLIYKEEFNEDRDLFLLLEFIKTSWIHNDKESVIKELGLNTVDVLRDSQFLVNASYKGRPVRDYLKFLRENLEVCYEDKEDKTIFLHAGIPYSVTNYDSINVLLKREFQGYFYDDNLKTICARVLKAIRKRTWKIWIAFSEASPLFACHPMDRKLEWDILPRFKNNINDMVADEFGYNAVVFGHSRHSPFKKTRNTDPPTEEELFKDYNEKTKRIRHTYNIDFGMSKAYHLSDGGWLTVEANDRIKVHMIIDNDKIRDYEFKYKK